jgi:signal transduction histidine kinase
MVWFAGPVTALIAGGYPRLAEARRRRSVADARRTQRLQLAQDLHDFVAHDLTGIVVQAQAAQHVGRTDPAVALTALQRIEVAGLHALASMDEALDILREGDGHVDHRSGASAQELTALLESFTVAGGPAVDAHIDEAAWKTLPAELAALGYRVLAEALTNVRRHAPDTRYVPVGLTAESDRPAGGRLRLAAHRAGVLHRVRHADRPAQLQPLLGRPLPQGRRPEDHRA